MHKKMLTSLTIITGILLITGCATDSNQSNITPSSSKNNAVTQSTAIAYSSDNVLIYDKNNAHPQSAEDITMIQVDVYNEYGIRRQQAQVNEMLKQQACLVGGNAVVIVDNPDKKHCYAQVIQTQPILNNEVPSTSTLVANPVSATTPKSQP